jgi:adenosylcobinamide-GDP ribazoletransferase
VLHELRLFFIALQFLTRVPVPRWVGFEPGWLNDSARHFPAVGLCVGAVGALVLWAAAHAWTAWIAVLLSMGATLWLTGAFHEDGLADTADGLGGHVSRERALAIMKDSRIGTYGAVALLLVLALKGAALHAMALRDLVAALAALPLAHTWSRAASVVLLATLRYAGDAEHAKAKPMAQQVGGPALVMALVWALLAGLVAGLAWGAAPLIVAALVAAVTTAVMARWLWLRLGGYTGDTLGATQQVVEVALYLTLSALLSRG